jgi:transcriptional regulator with XRE-family HTH domain
MKTFGQRLYKLRKDKDLSIDKCSGLTGVSAGAISEIENGANLKFETIEKIIIGLNLSPEEKYYLVFGEKLQENEKQMSNYDLLQKIDGIENKIESIFYVVAERDCTQKRGGGKRNKLKQVKKTQL